MNVAKVAVVGSGISGLSAAWSLSEWADVTVYESDRRLGGHTHTQQVRIDGIQTAVDTGFIVFNHRTYPGLKKWFELLGVETAKSEMSFSASMNGGDLEWCGSDLNTVFAQRRNLISPRFWGMLADMVRFNRQAPKFAADIRASQSLGPSLGEFLDQQKFGKLFLDAYLLPMAGAIWSCPVEQMRAFPMETFTRFCENHGLLQITDRPQWYTVRGGSNTYIEKLKSRALTEGRRIRWLAQHEVMQVRPEGLSHSARDSSATGVRQYVSVGGMHQQDTLVPSPFSETYDAVVLACHSDQSARLLHDAPIALAQIAGQVRYQKNHAFLHTDRALMPQRTRAWAAWNYMHDTDTNTQENSVSVTYWMNRLQPLPCATPVLVTLNPTRLPDPRLVMNEMHYDHPIFDGPAIHAQQRLPAHQGEGSIWLAGAWTRYGFHEDGFQSGVNAASMIKQRFADTPTGHDYAQAA